VNINYAEAATTLARSADKLVRGGWTTGIMADSEGRHCAIGAMFAVDAFWADDAVQAMAAYIKADPERFALLQVENDPGIGSSEIVTLWNDCHATGVDEVVSIMHDAAKWAKDRASA
jgi:hypothetical protein